MTRKRTYDREGRAHLVTSSCDRRRRLLDHERPKKVVLGVRNSQLASQRGRCLGFVLMPDHVHAIVRFPEPDQISHFMRQWQQRSSAQSPDCADFSPDTRIRPLSNARRHPAAPEAYSWSHPTRREGLGHVR